MISKRRRRKNKKKQKLLIIFKIRLVLLLLLLLSDFKDIRGKYVYTDISYLDFLWIFLSRNGNVHMHIATECKRR